MTPPSWPIARTSRWRFPQVDWLLLKYSQGDGNAGTLVVLCRLLHVESTWGAAAERSIGGDYGCCIVGPRPIIARFDQVHVGEFAAIDGQRRIRIDRMNEAGEDVEHAIELSLYRIIRRIITIPFAPVDVQRSMCRSPARLVPPLSGRTVPRAKSYNEKRSRKVRGSDRNMGHHLSLSVVEHRFGSNDRVG